MLFIFKYRCVFAPVCLDPNGTISVISRVIQLPDLSSSIVEHREESISLSTERSQVFQKFSSLRAETSVH